MKGSRIGLVLVVGLGCVVGAELARAEPEPAKATGGKAPPPAEPAKATGGKAPPPAEPAKATGGKASPRAGKPKPTGSKVSPRAGKPKPAGGKASLLAEPAKTTDEAAAPPAEPAKTAGEDAAPPAEPAKAGGGGALQQGEPTNASGAASLPSVGLPQASSSGALPQAELAPWDEGVTKEQRRQAARLFEDANEDLEASLPDKAVDKYRQALKLWPHPAIHYNLAMALIPLKQPVAVVEHLEKAIEHGLKGLNNQADKLAQAKQFLEVHLGQVANVEVSCQKVGAKVSVDNRHVFTVEKGKPNIYKGRVAIGKHTFVAEKPGFATPVDSPLIGPRETFRIELQLFTADELKRYKRLWPKRTWAPWIVIGGGALIGLVGGGLQLSATSSYRQFNTELRRCSDDVGGLSCDASGFTSLRDSGNLKHTLGTVGYGVAAAAVVTGGLLLYLNRRVSYLITTDEYRMELLRKQRQQQQTKAITLAPLVGPGMGGAVVMGRL
jgi:hypothetical protein